MEWSKYNYYFYSKRLNTHLLYNSSTNIFLEFDENSHIDLMKIKENPEMLDLTCTEHKLLVRSRVFVDNIEDEINRNKVLELTKRYNNQSLKLTIAPTQACNFNCIYCYEKCRPENYMTESIEAKLIEHIERYPNLESFEVVWYGGEPLLAKDSILRLSAKFISLCSNYKASIVTNGYLLDEEFINKMSELKISFAQITIDGIQETHNQRRPHLLDLDSYSVICSNIERLAKINKEIRIILRVNVDHKNKNEYHEVYKYFSQKYNGRVKVYPGYVHSFESGCKSTSCFSDRFEKATFLKKTYSNHDVYSNEFYPKNYFGTCMMRVLNSYLVGPRGELYKCWHHLGNDELIVGDISKNPFITNFNLLSRYLTSADYLDDSKCKNCILFPSCNGGCPELRIKNYYEKENHDVCLTAKGNLKTFLENHYLMKVKKESLKV